MDGSSDPVRTLRALESQIGVQQNEHASRQARGMEDNMKVDSPTKALLTVIAVLLLVLIIRLEFQPSATFAAVKRIEYKQVRLPNNFSGNSEAILNEHGAQGWEIAYGFGEMIFLKRGK